MASLDELIEHFQAAVDEINDAINAVNAGEDGAGELENLYAGTGAEDKAGQLSQIKDAADSLRSYLQGAVDQASELIEQTKAAKG